MGPKGSGLLSPGLGFRSVGFGVCKSLGSKNLANTLKLKLAKVGLAKVGQAHSWPKSVKELAKVGLAKVGHDLVIRSPPCPEDGTDAGGSFGPKSNPS